MSYPTPPGWYPDSAAPGTERWWDGTAWTAHTRAPAAAPAPAPPYPSPPQGGAVGGTARAVALVAAGAVVVGAAVTAAVLLTRGDEPAPPRAGATRTPTSNGAGESSGTGATTAGPSPDGTPTRQDPALLVDQLNG